MLDVWKKLPSYHGLLQYDVHPKFLFVCFCAHTVTQKPEPEMRWALNVFATPPDLVCMQLEVDLMSKI